MRLFCSVALWLLAICLVPRASAQVELAVQIGSAGAGALPSSLTVYRDSLYLSANDRTGFGNELWAFSAQSGQARRVARLSPSGPGQNTGVANLTVFDGTLYFTADGDAAGGELWSTTGGGAQRLTNINTSGGTSIGALTVFQNALWMRADDGLDGAELWSYSDARPSADRARRETDLNPGPGPGVGLALPLVWDGVLYFSGDDGQGEEPWRIGGGAPELVADLSPAFTGSNPSDFTVYAGALYFAATEQVAGAGFVNSLYVTTGVGAAKAPGALPATVQTPRELAVYDGKLYFSGADGTTFDRELWVYDGAAATRVADLNPTGPSRPSNLTVFDGALIFSADDGQTGRELWRYESATGVATRLTDLVPGSEDGVRNGSAFQPIAFEGALYFAGNQGSSQNSQLYRYRPTPVSAAEAPGGAEARLTLTGPNPFAARTTLRLDGAGERLEAALYDALGRRVRVLFDGVVHDATNVTVDAAGLAPGVYVVRATDSRGASAQTLTVLR